MADSFASAQDHAETIRVIRHALHIGLESFGEVERVCDRYSMLQGFGQTLDPELQPLHPTGASDTIGKFAAALRLLEDLEPNPA